MKAPTGDPGDFCIALGAESTLLMPEIAKSVGAPKRFQHVSPFAFFEVGFIGWIVRVGFAFNLDVSLDGSAHGVVQPDFSRPSFVIAGFTEEGPVTVSAPFKVFGFEPARAFVRVSSSCPFPQTREEGVINASECAFAHHVPMIVRPTANLGVEVINQIGGRHAMCVFDDSSDALQEGSSILLGRLDEQFSVRISAHVVSEEIKAFLHVRNDCLRRREFKASFLQELPDEGFDLSFQQFFRLTGDDEVIRVTDEIDTGFFTSKGLETFSCRELFLQESFKSVQRAVSERGGDNSTLGSPIRRFVKDVLFHVPRFQPLSEDDSVYRDVSQEPIVGNLVETGLDVALQNPLRVCASQCKKALFDRIGAGPLLTKPIGVSIGGGFRNGDECEQIQRLRSILHRGNSERTHRFAVRLRDVNTSKGLRLITPTLESMHCLCFLLWCVPNFLVHTGSFLAIVFCHSSNGENFAAVGVG